MLPTDFDLHLNDFSHLVFIHVYTYLFKNWNLAFNLTFCINNKIVTTIRYNSYFSFGIIYGRLWGSLAVEDLLRSIFGIICGLGIICGWGSFAVLYRSLQKRSHQPNIKKPYQLSSCLQCNICKPEEGWYGQGKYCYGKTIHVVLISFAVVFFF